MSESMRVVDTGPDAYLASLPEKHRDTLTSVDRTIHRGYAVGRLDGDDGPSALVSGDVPSDPGLGEELAYTLHFGKAFWRGLTGHGHGSRRAKLDHSRIDQGQRCRSRWSLRRPIAVP